MLRAAAFRLRSVVAGPAVRASSVAAAAGLGAAVASAGAAAVCMRIEEDVKLDYKDVLLRPKRSTLKSRSEVDLNRNFRFRHSKREWTGVPLVVANMDTVGTFKMAKEMASHGCLVAVHKHYTVDEWKQFVAENPDTDMAKLDAILSACPSVTAICLDVANGYSESFVTVVKRVRERWPDHTIMAGNVVTNEMTEELIMHGADVVKVGIGPGSVCTTRKQTGVGYPQLSAVIECADAAHGLGGFVCADGGITCPGDAAKAFGGGADFIMMGGMFAGTEEAAGQTVERDGRKYKQFYGMSSNTAMKKHVGGVANYRSSEGKTVEVPHKGPVKALVLDLLGGLRSACTYIGATTLKEVPKRTTFIRVTQQLNQIFGSHDLGKAGG
jgi:GMP reductase